MAITNGYATLAEAKTALNVTDTVDDALIERAVESASRLVDQHTGRVFYGTDGAVRYFTADDGMVVVDDLRAITALETDENGDRIYERTWSATDYDLEPYSGPPYTRITRAPLGVYTFPRIAKSVKVTGNWGYCATGSHDAAITQATLLIAARLFKRKDAPFGVVGSAEVGFMRLPTSDQDVKQLLQRYVRLIF